MVGRSMAEEASAAGRQCLGYLAFVVGAYLVLDVANYLLPGGLDVTLERLCLVVISVALVRMLFLGWWWWHLRRSSRKGT
jgi:hypothetical protein